MTSVCASVSEQVGWGWRAADVTSLLLQEERGLRGEGKRAGGTEGRQGMGGREDACLQTYPAPQEHDPWSQGCAEGDTRALLAPLLLISHTAPSPKKLEAK